MNRWKARGLVTDEAASGIEALRPHDNKAVLVSATEPFDPPTRAGLRGPRQALDDPWRQISDVIVVIEATGLIATDERIIEALDDAGIPISDRTLRNYRRQNLAPAARNRRNGP